MEKRLQRLLLHGTLTRSAEERPPTFQPHEEAFNFMASASKVSPLVSGKAETYIHLKYKSSIYFGSFLFSKD